MKETGYIGIAMEPNVWVDMTLFGVVGAKNWNETGEAYPDKEEDVE